MSDSKRLKMALIDVAANFHQCKMAAILLSVNGIENAIEFVYGLRDRGLTNQAQKTLFPGPNLDSAATPLTAAVEHPVGPGVFKN